MQTGWSPPGDVLRRRKSRYGDYVVMTRLQVVAIKVSSPKREEWIDASMTRF